MLITCGPLAVATPNMFDCMLKNGGQEGAFGPSCTLEQAQLKATSLQRAGWITSMETCSCRVLRLIAEEVSLEGWDHCVGVVGASVHSANLKKETA